MEPVAVQKGAARKVKCGIQIHLINDLRCPEIFATEAAYPVRKARDTLGS